MVHSWSKATDGSGADVRVFVLDYKKAFDFIDHSLLISKLRHYDINAHIINWILDFLTNRKQRVKLGRDCFSEWGSVPAGVPQGTKLGPWLFIIMINDLEAPSTHDLFKHVDDTTFYEVVMKDDTSKAQIPMNEIQHWSNNKKFQLHPTKCKELCISFSRSKPIHSVTIGTNVVEPVQSIKILGVIFQNDLKWNLHVENSIKKAARRLYFIVQLKRANVSVRDLTTFYVSCIQSVLLYACQVFHFSLPEYLNTNMERIQKRVMRIIHGYDVSYEQALIPSGLSSLQQRRSELCSSFFNKILTQPNGQLHQLLPYNDSILPVNLRKKQTFKIPRCKTNRFKNTSINASVNSYNNSFS